MMAPGAFMGGQPQIRFLLRKSPPDADSNYPSVGSTEARSVQTDFCFGEFLLGT